LIAVAFSPIQGIKKLQRTYYKVAAAHQRYHFGAISANGMDATRSEWYKEMHN
jgi:hypothetical protein